MVLNIGKRNEDMGYLISGHLLRQEADFSKLNTLPASIGWDVYVIEKNGVFAIDTFDVRRRPGSPFQCLPPSRDLSVDLVGELAIFGALFNALNQRQLGNSFKRSTLHLNCILSQLLGQEVLSFCSDDDGLDFTCVSYGGVLSRLHFAAGDLEILYEHGQTRIQPMSPESEADQDLLSDLDELRRELPGCNVLPRDRVMPTQLHDLANSETTAFCGTSESILGLGLWDPPELGIQRVASRGNSESSGKTRGKVPPSASPTEKEKWWRFWK